jgi:Domain of unknown function (DUF4384)
VRIPAVLGLLAATVTGCAFSQQSNESTGARELFYFAKSPKDKLAPIVKTPPSKSPKGTAQPPAGGAGALHLGLRYTLVLVTDARKSETVDSDRLFHNGECVAIDFEANRSGYLYVLAKQASGDWLPLLPSLEMPGESNILNPEGTTRVPKDYCFEMKNPPGTETLFVVLSRDPRDVYELNEGIKGNTTEPQPKPPARASAPAQVANAREVNTAVQRMSQQFGSRDIAFRKITQPQDSQEPAHVVYAVNSSSKPASSIAIRIAIRHVQ